MNRGAYNSHHNCIRSSGNRLRGITLAILEIRVDLKNSHICHRNQILYFV